MNVTEDVITLQVPASAEYIDLVRLTLYGLAVKMGFSYEEIEDMKVAVSEACNNAVLYAYDHLHAGEAAKALIPWPRMEVQLVKRDDALSIIVKDGGNSFDSTSAARRATLINNDRSSQELQARGLGLYLMEALMDDVEVNRNTGTEVVLTKRLVKSGEM